MYHRLLVLVAAAVTVAMSVPGRASAHDLHGKVMLPPDSVVVEGDFDGIPAEEARVTITDAAGNVVATGKTDEKGICRFPKLGAGKYLAVIESVGHRDAIEFEVAGELAAIEYSNWRLNKTVGVVVGVGGLLAASAAFWWFRQRKAG